MKALQLTIFQAAAAGFPHSYLMARVARRNRLQSVQVDGAGQFARAVPNSLLSFPVGSFENAGDSRQYILQNFHRVCNKLNATMSVDPKDLLCLGCQEKHAFLRSCVGAHHPVCAILADQCFPPFIPAKLNERCMAVLRVEDARLTDLSAIFRAVFRMNTGSGGSLPDGSVVMVGSQSDLAVSGLAAYVEELTRTIRSSYTAAGVGTTVL